VRASAKHNVVTPQVDQLGGTKTTLQRHEQDRMVTPPDPRRLIGCRKQRIDLRSI
jgi:hypothetical protein